MTQIIDPYTIQLENGSLINLIGIDYPDYNFKQQGEYSLLAYEILNDMLVGKIIQTYVTPDDDLGRTNRMGHMLAHVERVEDTLWVQGTLLELGLARVMTNARNPQMAEQMYMAEQKARNEEPPMGIWAHERYAVIPADAAKDYIDTIGVVEGDVVGTAIRDNRIFINFGADWRNDFTVSIAPENRRVFSKAGIDPLSWRGKRLRVRGWIDSYNGPYIEITHPQAVEILDENNLAGDTE